MKTATILKKTANYILTFILLILTAMLLYTTFTDFDTAVDNLSEWTGIAFNEIEWDAPYDRGIPALSYIYHNTYSTTTFISGVSALLGIIFLYRGRSLLEMMLLFMFGFIPRQRKTWGKIIDTSTSKAVQFAVVRLYYIDENNKPVFVGQAVSDTDGRYNISIKAGQGHRYFVEVQADGFEKYWEEVPASVIDFSVNELVIDIPLVRKSKPNNFRKVLLNLRPWFYKYLIYYLFVVSIITFMREFYGIFIFGNPVTYFLGIMTGLGVIWNIFVLTERFRTRTGHVMETHSKRGLNSIVFAIFKKKMVSAKYVTNPDGTLWTDLKPGSYLARLMTEGYHPQKIDDNGFIKVKINSQGMLKNDILLYRKGVGNKQTGPSIPNPFE